MSIKEKIDICYVSGLHGDALVPSLAKICLKEKIKLLVITENYSDFKLWSEQGVFCEYIYNLKSGTSGNVFEEIKKTMSIDSLINTEWSYYNVPKIFLKRKCNVLSDCVEGLIRNYEIKVVLQRPGGEILRRILFNYKDKSDYEIVVLGENYCNGFSTLYKDEFKTFYFSDNKQVKKIKELLKAKFDGGNVIKYTKGIVYSKNDKKKSKLNVFIDLVSKANFGVIYSYFSIRFKLEIIGRIRRHIYNFMAMTEKDFLLDKNKKFYFPLNVSAESELFVRNSFFSDQFFVIKKLLHLKPHNDTFYIKSHPGNSKSLSIYELIYLKFLGVKILDSKIKTKMIVKSVDGVFGVSSTVLFESIYFNTPVHIIGAWPYSDQLLKISNQLNDKIIIDFFRYPSNYKFDYDNLIEKYSNVLFEGDIYTDLSTLTDITRSIQNLIVDNFE